MRRIFLNELRRPTFWIAIAALLSSLMGTAYAAGMIGSAEIRDGSIRSQDIHDDQVASGDIRNLSISAADIAKDAITSTKIKNGTIRQGDFAGGAVTAASIGTAAVGANALADGSVTERALDPSFARIYSFSGLATPGQAERVLLSRGGYEYRIRCDDLGAGERETVFTVRRTDGSLGWGAGGVRNYIDLGMPGNDPTDPIGGGGVPALVFNNPSTVRAAEFYDLFLSTIGSLDTYRVTAVSSNVYGADPVCLVAGTVVPINLS